MADQNSIKIIFSKLKLPQQDIDLLTFCKSNRAAKVAAWVDDLKTTQVIKTCGLLYQAIPQVNRLNTPYIERKAMLDTLFLVAYPCAQTLSKEFLNQPIMLPEPAQRMALIAQSLLNEIAIGYLICLRDLCEEKKLKTVQRQAASEAVLSSLHCLAVMQLRNLQLYGQASKTVWRNANSLMLIARHLDIEGVLIKPKLSGLPTSTSLQCFLKMIALAGARTNQMTQIDMGHLFKALDQWVRTIKLSSEATTFWIEIDKDLPPVFSLRQAPSQGEHVININFQPLTQQLANALKGERELVKTQDKIIIPPEINSSMVMHLEHAWGHNTTRGSNRRTSEHTAEVIVGFQQCHSKLSGYDDFNEFLGQSSISSAKKDSDMPDFASLMSALTPEGESTTPNTASTITPLRVLTKNISKEGYCFIWEGNEPMRIDAGDVIAVRERAKRTWGLGVIRWIKKLKQHSLLGVELLSSKPQAVAASCSQDEGGYSDFMRAFILANTHPQKPATLLSANLVFKDRAKIKIREQDQKKPSSASLGECLLTTGKVKSFVLYQQATEQTVGGEEKHRL